MNRSVQYELSGDSMQGGSERIGSLRDNGDMGTQRTLVENEYWRRQYSGTFVLNAGIDREHESTLAYRTAGFIFFLRTPPWLAVY